MTPVILLTDGFLANGAEPWRIPKMAELPEIVAPLAKEGDEYKPYARDDKRLARRWAVPGTKGLEHRIGGLEKMDVVGTISYVPENHQVMTDIRSERIRRIANYIPELEVKGKEDSEVLVVGWGGTYGHLITAVRELQKEGKNIALAHFNYIFPLPKNTNEVLKRYKKIIVCELNDGQFVEYLRSQLHDLKFEQYNKSQGLPFTVLELKERFNQLLEEK